MNSREVSDPWLQLLEGDSHCNSSLPSMVDDADSSLPSTVDQGIQSNVEGSSSRSRSRSRSRRLRRQLWAAASLRQLLEPNAGIAEAAGCSLADLEVLDVEEKIVNLNLPIYCHFYEADPKNSIRSLMVRMAVSRFYIGATIDPIRRWRGGTSDVRESEMPGHCQLWESMHLIAVCENELGQHAAKQLEAELIRFAKANWPETCANKVADARGQVMGINFMYMVVCDGS